MRVGKTLRPPRLVGPHVLFDCLAKAATAELGKLSCAKWSRFRPSLRAAPCQLAEHVKHDGAYSGKSAAAPDDFVMLPQS